MNHIKYNNRWFNFYSHAQYPGKSILTEKAINIGDSIYWSKGFGGFLAEEVELINVFNTNSSVPYHHGPVNKAWTCDDSVSREMARKVFKREYNIDLKDHNGLFVKNENSFKDPFRKYTNIKFNKVILCGSCLRWKVERAHHCRQCGKCVLKMDHHCPWLASCIGFRNYKYFLLIQLHGLIATIIVFFSFIEAIINFNMNDDTDLFLLVGVFFGWACDGGLMAFLLWLFCINWKLMFKGETVIENSDKIRFPSAKMNNIYDLGTYKNFTTVFGNSPLVWFIPAFPNYDGDGISYETNVKDNNQ